MPIATYNRTITQVAITQGAAGQLDLVAAAPGLKIYVVSFVVTMSAAGTITFNEGTGPTALSGAMDVAASGGFVVTGNGNDGVILQTNTANSKLGLVSTTGIAKGWLRYFLDT